MRVKNVRAPSAPFWRTGTLARPDVLLLPGRAGVPVLLSCFSPGTGRSARPTFLLLPGRAGVPVLLSCFFQGRAGVPVLLS